MFSGKVRALYRSVILAHDDMTRSDTNRSACRRLGLCDTVICLLMLTETDQHISSSPMVQKVEDKKIGVRFCSVTLSSQDH